MNRSELVWRLVLNEISDDYENVDQIILRNVSKTCTKLGFTIERSNIVEALAYLMEEGLAKAYALSCREPFLTELPLMPPLDVVEENFKTYFYITKKGMNFHLSNRATYPFDDDGDPRG